MGKLIYLCSFKGDNNDAFFGKKKILFFRQHLYNLNLGKFIFDEVVINYFENYRISDSNQ